MMVVIADRWITGPFRQLLQTDPLTSMTSEKFLYLSGLLAASDGNVAQTGLSKKRQFIHSCTEKSRKQPWLQVQLDRSFSLRKHPRDIVSYKEASILRLFALRKQNSEFFFNSPNKTASWSPLYLCSRPCVFLYLL